MARGHYQKALEDLEYIKSTFSFTPEDRPQPGPVLSRPCPVVLP